MGTPPSSAAPPTTCIMWLLSQNPVSSLLPQLHHLPPGFPSLLQSNLSKVGSCRLNDQTQMHFVGMKVPSKFTLSLFQQVFSEHRLCITDRAGRFVLRLLCPSPGEGLQMAPRRRLPESHMSVYILSLLPAKSLSFFFFFAGRVPSQLSNPFKYHLSRKSFLSPLRIIPTYDFPLILSYFCYLSYFLPSSFPFSPPSLPSFLFPTLFALHWSLFRQRTRLISSLSLQLPGARRPHIRM